MSDLTPDRLREAIARFRESSPLTAAQAAGAAGVATKTWMRAANGLPIRTQSAQRIARFVAADHGYQAAWTVRIQEDARGLWAEVAELPGCFAAGTNWAELGESIGEGIRLYTSKDGVS